MLRIIKAEIFANANNARTTLHIIKGALGNLLGLTLLQVALKIINQFKPDETGLQSPLNRDSESLFSGIGKVEGKVIKPHIDSDIEPKQ